MAGKELAVLDTKAIQAALLDGVALPQVDDPEAVARQIMERILQADTIDAVFEDAGAIPARDVIGVPLEITNVRWNKSDHDKGPGVYALLTATRLDTGELVTVTCGAANVMAQLLRLMQLGGIPPAVKITEAEKATAAGRKPMWLVKA